MSCTSRNTEVGTKRTRRAPSAATILANLAINWRHTGRVWAATDLFREALVACERARGGDHFRGRVSARGARSQLRRMRTHRPRRAVVAPSPRYSRTDSRPGSSTDWQTLNNLALNCRDRGQLAELSRASTWLASLRQSRQAERSKAAPNRNAHVSLESKFLWPRRNTPHTSPLQILDTGCWFICSHAGTFLGGPSPELGPAQTAPPGGP
jgi:hypothetical protein